MSKKNDNTNPVTVEEIQALRAEISLMHTSLATDVVGHAPLIQKVVERFVEYGLNKEWTEKLLAPLAGSTFEDDEALLIAYVLEELDILLNIATEEKSLKKRVHIIVGATGIGKTSLVGKLAARYKYFLEESHNVVFFNFDRQKVGAVEQLENYADAMDIRLIKEEEFLEEEFDVVLVDTAGSKGDNLEELEAFIELIRSNTSYSVVISLALSATSKQKDLENISKAFELFPIENLMLTKLDETSDLSDMINFLIGQKLPISYISTGQAIPEDLEVATREYLLKQI